MSAPAIEFLYGPNDGDAWPPDVPDPEIAVLVGTTLRGANGLPLLARYLPATTEGPLFSKRDVLLFDGWYCNQPGDSYGPRTGGIQT